MENYNIPILKVLFERVSPLASVKNEQRLWARRLALVENMNMYYQYAISCVRRIEIASIETANLISKNEDTLKSEKSDFDYYSSAIAFYGFTKVVIETARHLKEDALLNTSDATTIKELIKLGRKYRTWANDVIKARNDITAHPHSARNGMRKFVIGPSSTSSSEDISFKAFNLEELSFTDAFDLTPKADLGELKKYIEELVKLLDQAWFNNS